MDHALTAAVLNDYFNIAVRNECFCAHPYVREMITEALSEEADDLTAVALTTAEGMWDLRTVRWVDGELTVFAPFEEPYGPTPPAGATVQGFGTSSAHDAFFAEAVRRRSVRH